MPFGRAFSLYITNRKERYIYLINTVIKKLKGVSAKRWFKLFPETQDELWNGHLWHGTYFAGTTGDVSSDIVLGYIEEQKSEPPIS